MAAVGEALARACNIPNPFNVCSIVHISRLALLILLTAPSLAAAQAPGASSQPADDPLRFVMPTITVTAQKEPADRQKVPVSVTAVTRETIDQAGIRIVSEAAIHAPNTFFTEWTARRLSTARFRGIGSSPGNPGVTTFIDGVPQLNENSSSIELLDVEQIEFVRGPQSALFGRNTLGGLVNVTSSRPSRNAWTGSLSLPIGNNGAWSVRGGVSGPVSESLALGFSVAQVSRDGFTVNDVTGNDIDDRSAFSAKGQLLWAPNANWETRVIVTGERARDGDYGLQDVAALRANPFRAARDFEGFANRDIFGTTILVRRSGGPVVMSSTTGFLKWKTQDVTDLDYTPQPLIRRDNTEEAFQFTQEVRFASADNAPVALSDRAQLRWQGGVFLFTQNYDQNAVNQFSPFAFAPFPVSQTSPLSALDDVGVGVFGQGTVTFADRIDVSAGLRVDYESKEADLQTFYDPAVAPAARVQADESFSNVSPQFSVAYRATPQHTIYGTVGRGFKAGGFNPASPPGGETYGEEHTWNVEGGVKTAWAGGRISANAAVFYIDWDDLQLNVPNPAVPAQFYIANAGSATSKGFELELAARAAPGVDVFATYGHTHARFGPGRASTEGNRLPNTPDYTTSFGAQYARGVAGGTMLARAEAVFYGAFQYDDANSLGQQAYSLVNLRGAYRARRWLVEVFVRNAFDTEYIPIAIAYPNFAPSGFLGEMGPPRTFGVSLGVRF